MPGEFAQVTATVKATEPNVAMWWIALIGPLKSQRLSGGRHRFFKDISSSVSSTSNRARANSVVFSFLTVFPPLKSNVVHCHLPQHMMAWMRLQLSSCVIMFNPRFRWLWRPNLESLGRNLPAPRSFPPLVLPRKGKNCWRSDVGTANCADRAGTSYSHRRRGRIFLWMVQSSSISSGGFLMAGTPKSSILQDLPL